jgi:hypothetical protein
MAAMRVSSIASIVLLAASLTACAAKAQVRTEAEVPPLDPPPPPPRVVAVYAPEPEPLPVTPAVEPAVPARPPARPARPEQKPEPATVTPEPPVEPARPSTAPSLTLTPSPGSESQTLAAIRDLLGRAGRDLSRVNPATLNNDGRAQYDQARRFIQQAEEALKTRNIVFAGKLADKAATMAAVLVR